jgi:hypothetical protein
MVAGAHVSAPSRRGGGMVDGHGYHRRPQWGFNGSCLEDVAFNLVVYGSLLFSVMFWACLLYAVLRS